VVVNLRYIFFICQILSAVFLGLLLLNVVGFLFGGKLNVRPDGTHIKLKDIISRFFRFPTKISKGNPGLGRMFLVLVLSIGLISFGLSCIPPFSSQRGGLFTIWSFHTGQYITIDDQSEWASVDTVSFWGQQRHYIHSVPGGDYTRTFDNEREAHRSLIPGEATIYTDDTGVFCHITIPKEE
jgi:hypothetical protein